MVDALQKKECRLAMHNTRDYLPLGIIKAGFLPFSSADFEPSKFVSVHIDRLIFELSLTALPYAAASVSSATCRSVEKVHRARRYCTV